MSNPIATTAAPDPFRWFRPENVLFFVVFPGLRDRPKTTRHERETLMVEAMAMLGNWAEIALHLEGTDDLEAVEHLRSQFIERMSFQLVDRFEQRPDHRFIRRALRLMAKERLHNRLRPLDSEIEPASTRREPPDDVEMAGDLNALQEAWDALSPRHQAATCRSFGSVFGCDPSTRFLRHLKPKDGDEALAHLTTLVALHSDRGVTADQ